MSEHTLKFFGEELSQLKAEVARLGGLAEAQLTDAIEAVANRDVALAQAVIGRDDKLDAAQRDIERKAIRMIALRQPVAQDLRRTVGALKMSLTLERAGDYAKNIAKRVPLIAESSSIKPSTLLPAMAQVAGEMVHDVLNAFAARDASLAEAVCGRDKVVDDFYNSIFRTLVTYMMENPRHITQSAHLLFIAKNIERIGDHATNIAEMVYFAATGQHLPERERGEHPTEPHEE